MPKQKKRTFKEEQAAFDAAKKRHAEGKARKAAGKPVKTEGQKRTEGATRRRKEIMESTPGTSGLQFLTDILAPKPKKKK